MILHNVLSQFFEQEHEASSPLRLLRIAAIRICVSVEYANTRERATDDSLLSLTTRFA